MSNENAAKGYKIVVSDYSAEFGYRDIVLGNTAQFSSLSNKEKEVKRLEWQTLLRKEFGDDDFILQIPDKILNCKHDDSATQTIPSSSTTNTNTPTASTIQTDD